MKGKKLSKVLALLLAFMMIFSTVSIIAYADAEEPYVVSYGAPAVLMNEQTWVNLNDIYVEMKDDGTNSSGAEITWSAEQQDGLVFDAVSKTIYAEKEGRYKLIATANGVAKKVFEEKVNSIKDAVLCVDIIATSEVKGYAKDWNLGGEEVIIGVEKVL